jgi:type I restriction enzyme, R subunit
LIQILIAQTQALEENSFVVRQHLQVVEKYREANSWNALTDLDIREIFEHIAPIVVETNEEETAKRFDAIAYELQLAIFTGEKKQVKLSEQIKGIAGKLTKKASIPLVAQKMDVLKAVQNDVYWTNANVLGLEKLRVDLRDIIKFLESNSRQIVYTDYEDTIIGAAEERTIVYGVNELDAYKRKVNEYFLTHQTHLTIHKLKTNQPVTVLEITELERMLFEQGTLGTKETFLKAYGNQPLGKFIRSIVGLEVTAVNAAFAELLQNHNFNTAQIRFIETLIHYFTVKGTIELPMLFVSPFTDLNPRSIMGLFDPQTSDKIRQIIDSVNYNAAVA